MAWRPTPDNTWWTNWLSQIAGNDTVPDQYSYHLEGAVDAVDNDPQYTNSSLASLLEQYGLPSRQINVNEYAEFSEMLPSGYAWWISRLERYNFIGILGNWQGGTQLHDLFANLLTKIDDPSNYTATDYAPAPGYNVYQYYATNMTGQRLQTTGSGDNWFDSYATLGDRIRILAGTKVQEGSWKLSIDNLAAVGYEGSGSINVDVYSFVGSSVQDIVYGATFIGITSYSYADGSLVVPITQSDISTAWAFEFDVSN
jgi:hypothetical protein